VPGKRAHSKNDKYEQHNGEPVMNVGMAGPMSGMTGGQIGGAMGGMHHAGAE